MFPTPKRPRIDDSAVTAPMPSQSDSAAKSTRRAGLRALIILGAAIAVVLGSALQGLGAELSWFSLGGMSNAVMKAPIGEHLPAGKLGEPELAAAKPRGDTRAKDKGKADKHDKDQDKGDTKAKDKSKDATKTKGNGDKKDKPKASKHEKGKGDKPQKGSGEKKTTVLAVADGWVEKGNPTSTFNSVELEVDGKADPDVESYLRFDVSGLTTPVQRATLRLWVPAGGDTADGPAVYRARTGWAEGTLTWANRPKSVGNVVDDTGAVPEEAWVEYDVTEVITGNGTYAFALIPQSSDEATFDSREGANPPQLVLATRTNRDAAPDPPRTGGPKAKPKRGAKADPDAADRGTNADVASPDTVDSGPRGDTELTPDAAPRIDGGGDRGTDAQAGADTEPAATIAGGTTTDAEPGATRAADVTPDANTDADTGADPSQLVPALSQDPQPNAEPKSSRKEKRGTTESRIQVAAAAAPLTLVPAADAQVTEATPNATSGTLLQLLVDGGSDPDVESYLRFDVSGITAPVQRATLRLWVQPNGGTKDGPSIQATGTNWNETSLTWNTRPTPTSGTLDDKGRLPGSSWAEYDVTAAVSGNGTVSFVLLPQSEDGAVFDSREGAIPPQLMLELSPDPTPTPVPTVEPTTTATPTLTPEPTATATPTATSTTVPGAGIFNDDFESGTMGQWTSVSGPIVPQQADVARGAWAARATSTGAAAYASKTLNVAQTDLYYRIKFKLGTSPTDVLYLGKFRTSTNASILGVYVSNTGKLSLRNDAGVTTRISSQSVSSGTWHEVQVHVRVDAANPATGQVEVWYDGAPVADLSRAENLGANPVGRLQLGENDATRTFDLAFDDVVADSSFIGTPSGTPTP